jgi:hypothetical protein
LAKQEEHLKLDTKKTFMLYEITDQIKDTPDTDTVNTYGNIESTMTIIRKARKGKFLNSLEKYYIFLASK